MKNDDSTRDIDDSYRKEKPAASATQQQGCERTAQELMPQVSVAATSNENCCCQGSSVDIDQAVEDVSHVNPFQTPQVDDPCGEGTAPSEAKPASQQDCNGINARPLDEVAEFEPGGSGGGLNLSAKGQLHTHDGTLDAALPVGANDTVLTAQASEPTGLKWNDILKLLGLHLKATTPALITANQDNYSPGPGTFFRLSSDAARDITGIAAGSDGRGLILANVGTNAITLKHESASSNPENRITSATGRDIVLTANETVWLQYDATTQRWRADKPQLILERDTGNQRVALFNEDDVVVLGADTTAPPHSRDKLFVPDEFASTGDAGIGIQATAKPYIRLKNTSDAGSPRYFINADAGSLFRVAHGTTDDPSGSLSEMIRYVPGITAGASMFRLAHSVATGGFLTYHPETAGGSSRWLQIHDGSSGGSMMLVIGGIDPSGGGLGAYSLVLGGGASVAQLIKGPSVLSLEFNQTFANKLWKVVTLNEFSLTPGDGSAFGFYEAFGAVSALAMHANGDVIVPTGHLGVKKDVQCEDQDVSPVAARRLRVIDGLWRAADTAQVEGRYVSRSSLQSVDLIRESGGPTDLSVGAIADGQALKRSGSTIVGAPAAPSMTETEIDFGAAGVNETVFTIVDAAVSASSKIIAKVARKAPTGKEQDEADMDPLELTATPASGQFDLFAKGLEGPVYGAFKIWYLAG